MSWLTMKDWSLSRILAAVLVVTNIGLTGFNVFTRIPSTKSYAYLDDDFPVYFPVEIGEAAMVIEDTKHYNLREDAAWNSIFPKDNHGFVYLGSKSVPYGLSMFHQMHCLDTIRKALWNRYENSTLSLPVHTTHCLDYMRQMIHCAADTHMEPVFLDLPWKAVDSYGLHRCRDWEQVYDEAAKNAVEHNKFLEAQKSSNGGSST